MFIIKVATFKHVKESKHRISYDYVGNKDDMILFLNTIILGKFTIWKYCIIFCKA